MYILIFTFLPLISTFYSFFNSIWSFRYINSFSNSFFYLSYFSVMSFTKSLLFSFSKIFFVTIFKKYVVYIFNHFSLPNHLFATLPLILIFLTCKIRIIFSTSDFLSLSKKYLVSQLTPFFFLKWFIVRLHAARTLRFITV